jgi:sugar phosphate isomerase/epimerase
MDPKRRLLTQGIGAWSMTSLLPSHPSILRKSKLAFTTLGCPDWSWEEILTFAAKNDYQGIEIRGVKRELDLPKSPVFATPAAIKLARQKAQDLNLNIVGLGSSATLHYIDKTKLDIEIQNGKRFVDLAQALGAPYVRVYPNNLPKEQDKVATMDHIAQGLVLLADYARKANVKILLETHGDLLQSMDILYVMRKANHPNVGLIWDMFNMWSVTKEDPASMYKALWPYIYHVHLKDAVYKDGKYQYVWMGRGESPIWSAVDLLHKDGYNGYYSFEWEKLWHPELDEPAPVMTDYVAQMRARLKEKTSTISILPKKSR